MIFENVKMLCEKNKMTITRLCVELTGSKGNIPTWKKDNFRADILKKIADKFNVSVDFLFTGDLSIHEVPTLPKDSQKILKLYESLDDKDKGKVEGFIEALADQSKS